MKIMAFNCRRSMTRSKKDSWIIKRLRKKIKNQSNKYKLM